MLVWISDTIILFVASLVRLYFNFSFTDIFLYVLSNSSPRFELGLTLVPRHLYDFATYIGVQLWNDWNWLQTVDSFWDVPNIIHSVLPASNFIINSFSVKFLDRLFYSLFGIDYTGRTSFSEANITLSSANWITSHYLGISKQSPKWIKNILSPKLDMNLTIFNL